MINIRKEITNPHTLYITKLILYRTRTEKGLEAYEIMKRLVYVAYRMGGKGYIDYDTFLNLAIIWLNRKDSIYNFMNLGRLLGSRLELTSATIFGIDVNIVVNGTYAQIERQISDKAKELRITLN